MRDNFIKTKEIEYISIDDYINYYSQIPSTLWSDKAIFYFKKDKFDALGLIGERIHEFNLYSKTIEMYFKDCINTSITKAIDGKDELYMDEKDSKKRFLKYLYKIKEDVSVNQYKKAYVKSKKIIHGRYY